MQYAHFGSFVFRLYLIPLLFLTCSWRIVWAHFSQFQSKRFVTASAKSSFAITCSAHPHTPITHPIVTHRLIIFAFPSFWHFVLIRNAFRIDPLHHVPPKAQGSSTTAGRGSICKLLISMFLCQSYLELVRISILENTYSKTSNCQNDKHRGTEKQVQFAIWAIRIRA